MMIYMEGKQAKTLLTILEILKQETDINHTMTQKQIQDRLETWNPLEPIVCDRRAVRRHITSLQELGFPVIANTETSRIVPDKKTGEPVEDIMLSDFYYESDFDNSELRILIDSLLFSKYIPYKQCKSLVEKLEKLSNKYFKTSIKHIRTLPDSIPQNRELTYTIEILDEAMSNNKQVKFFYNSYGTDRKLHARLDSDGNPREYIVNPYQIAAANSRYYLICNLDKYDDVSNYRIDRITGIQLLDKPRKPMKNVTGLENGLNLPKHMAEHVYMFTGPSAPVTFRMKKYVLTDIMDYFGNDISFFDETDDEVSARVTVNLMAMRHWAVQYAVHAKILSPQSLVDDVKTDLRKAMENYGQCEEKILDGPDSYMPG